jgi:VWFA-related protein
VPEVKHWLRITLGLGLVLHTTGGPVLPNPQEPPDDATNAEQSVPLVRTHADAVLLDVVVRDRRGRPVRDLRIDEIVVYEDGVKQEIREFRTRQEMLVSREPAGEDEAPELRTAPTPDVDPFRYLNLVSLVFDRLSLEGRRFARQGALDFLETGIDENTLVAVFVIDHRLGVVEPFTTDRAALRTAVERATTFDYTRFASESDAIERGLAELSAAGAAAASAADGVGADSVPSGDFGADFRAEAMAEMTVNMLQKSRELARQQQGTASIYALLALAGEQRRLAGRKTVLFFSEGIQVPPNLVDRFRYTIGAANQANVSVYAVDARGLTSQGQMGESGQVLGQAARASRAQQQSGLGRAVTREQVMIFENAETSLRLNPHGTLADLAEGTGGILIANTNDLRPSMRHLVEDLQVYYELAYIPKNPLFDGTFRQIRVDVSRPDVVVQSRSGYFAMPPLSSDAPPVFPYEVPLLAALGSDPPPHDFDYRFRALRFHPSGDEFQYTLVAEIPLSSFTFRTDPAADTYTTRFSVVAIVRDTEDRIVRKISQDYPLVGPLDRLESFRDSEMVFVRQFSLPSGRYRLDMAAYDEESNRVSARRSVLVVPSRGEGVGLSALSMIRRIDPVEQPGADQDRNPFVIESGKIVPNLTGRTFKGSGGNLLVFLVVYPSPSIADPPSLELQVLHSGQVLGGGVLDLPESNEKGEIPYIATLPIDQLEPGRYEIRALVRQGDSTAVEHGFFVVEM